MPFRALEEQVEERMNRTDLYKDLPRGRKRRGPNLGTQPTKGLFLPN
jgi:hypothetical protein